MKAVNLSYKKHSSHKEFLVETSEEKILLLKKNKENSVK